VRNGLSLAGCQPARACGPCLHAPVLHALEMICEAWSIARLATAMS
jgi:hypothetical protein